MRAASTPRSSGKANYPRVVPSDDHSTALRGREEPKQCPHGGPTSPRLRLLPEAVPRDGYGRPPDLRPIACRVWTGPYDGSAASNR
eukprot:5848399-Alexandrium_andersonii.AAC.1